MINIRPVSDLRNKYADIEELVLKEDENVYLTKNGYGSMVVMSLDKYCQITKEIEPEKAIERKIRNASIEKVLEKAEEKLDNSSQKYIGHEEVFSKARRIINGEK